MNIKIVMRSADPADLRANGEIRLRGSQAALKPNVSSRRGHATTVSLGKGLYTYVFGIDRDGSFSLIAVNATSGAEIGQLRNYKDRSTATVIRYFFEVP